MNNRGRRFKKLGSFLKEKRIAADLIQKNIADVLGYDSSQFVSNWERGLCAPPFDSLPMLCKLLNISRREMIDLILQETEHELEAKFDKSSRIRKLSS